MKMSSDLTMIFPTIERIPSLGGVHDDSSLPTRSQQTIVSKILPKLSTGNTEVLGLTEHGQEVACGSMRGPKAVALEGLPQVWMMASLQSHRWSSTLINLPSLHTLSPNDKTPTTHAIRTKLHTHGMDLESQVRVQ